ncbi:MAG: hypothetical protein AABX97_00980 [Candidatus Thermoplasmatota archaeon]
MRAPALALALLLVLVLASPHAAAEDFGAVGKVNKLISVVSTPQLEPGQSGVFVFRLNSTYTSAITNVRLNASIYEYATIDGQIPVDRTWPYSYPRIRENTSGGHDWSWTWLSIAPGTLLNLSFTVETAADSAQMPHGSVFSQSSYFVRFWLEFDGNVSGTMTRFRMASKGYFSEAAWDRATNATYTNPCIAPWCRGNLNLTVLGVDGILPDSAFGVKEPIPRWPFYALIVLAVFFLVLAFLFWVEENPGSYPKIESWWARTRGRLARFKPVRRPRKPSQPGT